MKPAFMYAGAAWVTLAAASAALAQESETGLVEQDAAGFEEAALPPSPSALEDAQMLLTDGRYDEALARASAAMAEDPTSHEAAYYMAMAQFALQQIPAAAASAQQALRLAPIDARETVQKLIEMIGSAEAPSASDAEAELALSEGRIARAAELFEALWRDNRRQVEYGLKAAELHQSRLSQPAEAARLYNAIVAAAPQSPEAEKAKAALTANGEAFRAERAKLVKAAYGQSWPQAKLSLEGALGIEPDNANVRNILLARAVDAGDLATARATLAEIARRGAPNTALMAAMPGMKAAMENAEYAGFVGEVVGSARAQEIATTAARNEAAGWTRMDLPTALAPLAQARKLYFFNGSSCYSGSQCGARVIHQIASFNVEDRCTLRLGFGGTVRNDYSTVNSTFRFSFDNFSPMQNWTTPDQSFSSWRLVEIKWPGERDDARVGFLVPDAATADTVIKLVSARVNSCGGFR